MFIELYRDDGFVLKNVSNCIDLLTGLKAIGVLSLILIHSRVRFKYTIFSLPQKALPVISIIKIRNKFFLIFAAFYTCCIQGLVVQLFKRLQTFYIPTFRTVNTASAPPRYWRQALTNLPVTTSSLTCSKGRNIKDIRSVPLYNKNYTKYSTEIIAHFHTII